jgi:hypothetical protein
MGVPVSVTVGVMVGATVVAGPLMKTASSLSLVEQMCALLQGQSETPLLLDLPVEVVTSNYGRNITITNYFFMITKSVILPSVPNTALVKWK